MSIYNRFYVELDIREKIYGTLPGNREIFEGWMQSKFDDPENVENTAKDLDLDKEIEKNTNQFRCDEIGIYMGSYQIKAMIRQCANLLGFTMDKRGSKQTVSEGSFIMGINADGDFTGEKVYLLPLRTEADGKDNFTGNVTDRRAVGALFPTVNSVNIPNFAFNSRSLQTECKTIGAGKNSTSRTLNSSLNTVKRLDSAHIVTWKQGNLTL